MGVPSELVYALVRRLAATGAAPSVLEQPIHYRHKHTGGVYEMIGTAKLQTDKPLFDMAEVVAYRGEDGGVWARAAAEFDDRFEHLRTPGVAAVERVGPGGWNRLAESLRALGEIDERIEELRRRYGLDAARDEAVKDPTTMTRPLPAMPEPFAVNELWGQNVDVYSKKQMRADRLAMIEWAAKVCGAIEWRCPQCAAHNDHEECEFPTAADYASALRAAGADGDGEGG